MFNYGDHIAYTSSTAYSSPGVPAPGFLYATSVQLGTLEGSVEIPSNLSK